MKHFLLNILPCAVLLALLIYGGRRDRQMIDLLTEEVRQTVRERNEARQDYETAVQTIIVWSNTVNVLKECIKAQDQRKGL